MLSHIQMLETPTTGLFTPHITRKSCDTGLYVFPNCTTGALMGVKYPSKFGSQVALLLRLAFDERDYTLPTYALSEDAAAEKLGINCATLRQWVKKGWIWYWTEWKKFGDSNVMFPLPGKIFSEIEVEALRLAKPRNL
jgi:hypothetical protein